jgi:hypothetical protein
MHNLFKFVFWVALILYILTLFTVSYVGVYLSYIAIPIIVISGLLMKITTPKQIETTLPKKEVAQVELESEIAKATSGFINQVNDGLISFNNSVGKFNEKMDLARDRTASLREESNRLKMARIEPKIRIKYAKNQIEIDENNKILKSLDAQIEKVEKQIDEVKMQCELEVEKRHFNN